MSSSLQEQFAALKPPYINKDVLTQCAFMLMRLMNDYLPVSNIDPAVIILIPSTQIYLPHIMTTRIQALYQKFHLHNQPGITVITEEPGAQEPELHSFLSAPALLLHSSLMSLEQPVDSIDGVVKQLMNCFVTGERYRSFVYYKHHPEIILLIKYAILMILFLNREMLQPEQRTYLDEQNQIFISRANYLRLNQSPNNLVYAWQTLDRTVVPVIVNLGCITCSAILCNIAASAELLLGGLITTNCLICCGVGGWIIGIVGCGACMCYIRAEDPRSSFPQMIRNIFDYGKAMSSRVAMAPNLSHQQESVSIQRAKTFLQQQKDLSAFICRVCFDPINPEGGAAIICNPDLRPLHLLCVACANTWATRQRTEYHRSPLCPTCRFDPAKPHVA